MMAFTLGSVLLGAVPSGARAEWPPDGAVVSTDSADQYNPTIASDGATGAIVTWQDYRNGSPDIFAQRMNASGSAMWTADGVALCTATNAQFVPAIVSDGEGGVIVTWQDERSGASNADVYAQRVNASGVVQWTANGVALSTAARVQQFPTIVSDAAGGAIVAWQDERSGTSIDIYAQRVDASGNVLWTANGVAVSTASLEQIAPVITSDGAGGAIVTWIDSRSGTFSTDIYAQRITASGTVHWTVGGVPLSTVAQNQENPAIISDGDGGAIVTWEDRRSGTHYDIYTQRVNASGVTQWTADGVALSTAAGHQDDPRIVSDGALGAIVTWRDARSGTGYDIYAQRIGASGAVQWPADGVALSTAVDNQESPAIAPDGAGGAVVTWQDFRSGDDYDIYAQVVDASGVVQSTPDGALLSAAANGQFAPKIVWDGGDGIVTWEDYRSGGADIYAQHIPIALVGVQETPPASVVMLTPNSPNPFSAGTAFVLDLRTDAHVTVDVLDVVGRRVRQLIRGQWGAGTTSVTFDGRDDAGRRLPSGVYFCCVTANGARVTNKMAIAQE